MNAHSFAVFRSITFFHPRWFFNVFVSFHPFKSWFIFEIAIRCCPPSSSSLISSFRHCCLDVCHALFFCIFDLTSMGSYRSVAIFRILVIHKLIEFKTKNRKKNARSRSFCPAATKQWFVSYVKKGGVYQRAISWSNQRNNCRCRLHLFLVSASLKLHAPEVLNTE